MKMVWLRCIEVLRESEKELITTALAADSRSRELEYDSQLDVKN